jgi:hypothetical protein
VSGQAHDVAHGGVGAPPAPKANVLVLDPAGSDDEHAPTPSNPIRRVFLHPQRPAVYPEVVRSLLDADLVILGPGSLYTSILPNLLVDDLARALCWSRAAKVYVCNVATQPGETDGYDVADHVRAIYRHVEDRLGISFARRSEGAPVAAPFTHVLVNNNLAPAMPPEWGVTRPGAGDATLAELGVEVLPADVVDEARPTRHDPAKLARALIGVYATLRPDPISSPLASLRSLARSLTRGASATSFAPAAAPSRLAD